MPIERLPLISSTFATLHDKSDNSWRIVPYGKKRSHMHAVKINSEELGVFNLKDGRLVNFSSQLHDGARMTMVEVFTPKGKLKGVERLKKLTLPANTGHVLVKRHQ